MALSVQRFDITSPDFQANPFPTLARMREAGPVVRTKFPIVGSVWMATTHDAANEVLRDHARFVRDARNAGRARFADVTWWLSQLFRAPVNNMLAKDEPDHRRLRGLVDQAFQRRSVEGMRERVRTIAKEVLDESVRQAGADGTIDFLEFSRQFPLAVICELLGLPDDDRPRFTEWASGFSRLNSLKDLLRLLPRMFRISRYFREEIQRCRANPRDGLLSLLVEAELAGDSLDEEELLAMAFLLLFAGHETTTHLICGGLLTLLDHPLQRAELAADWTKGERAVEELLRFNSPVQFAKPRMAREDIEFHGREIRRGAYVIPMLASANCDPAQFADPEQLDFNRTPNPHLGFGAGIHTCLGLKLARMEAAIAFERLLTAFPDLQLAVPRSEIQWAQRIGVRGLKALPLKLNSPTTAGRIDNPSV